MEPDTRTARLDLGRAVATMLIEGLIRDGKIDPVGKSEEDIEREFAHWYHEHGKTTFENLHLAIDYTESILAEADRHLAEGDVKFAAVMYAMYFEHWLNDMLSWGATRVGLDSASVSKMVRGSNLDAKTGYLWQLVFGERLADEIGASIRAVTEARNAFVHYKWRYHHINSDALDREEQELQGKLETCETVVQLTRDCERRLSVRFAAEYPLVAQEKPSGD